MCLDSEKLLELCDLYPRTGQSLKYRALDRRAYFLREQQLQEREFKKAARGAAAKLGAKIATIDVDHLNAHLTS